MTDPSAPEAGPPVLEARAVGKVYRAGSRAEVRALDDVSLAVPAGSWVAATGPSGSGKTTLLALLGALDWPSRGEVLFRGRSLAGCSGHELGRVRRRLGFVFQNAGLIPGLPAWENVAYPLVPRGVSRAERRARAEALLTRLGLIERLTALPEELSGGEQQRVAVARALAGEPEVLLADEPTSNLDPAAAEGLVALLREVHARGTTVFVASHDPRLVAVATRVYELVGGRLKTPSGPV
jgi:putative ABC transport system ATP-binding protein